MNLPEIFALLRRQWPAVAVLLVVAMGVLVNFKRAPQTYVDSGTIVFTGPTSIANPNPYNSFNSDLIITGFTLTDVLMSDESRREIAAEGGSGATYTVGLVNSYNLEYPNYSDPYATLLVTSSDVSAARRTFELVAARLQMLLANDQEKVPVHDRIEAQVVGETGALVTAGSSKRVYAGWLLLTLVAVIMTASAVDRRRGGRRLGALRIPWLGARVRSS